MIKTMMIKMIIIMTITTIVIEKIIIIITSLFRSFVALYIDKQT